ncbi:translation initiation factor IF-2 [Streptomyces sp. WAC 06783]|uniref:class I SAM-dependent methyltransferase n=1 Tax=Streptomyces sp. WAC 06783 TaxID=2203211 RepID=UPI000F73BEE0|nr:methyltransferase domain-containing protein [Streptomyces sp. WAC 06783]RSO05659.1 translation initiation factor IF-2 [Streptomyces sp. WAC 06783]
MPDFLAESLRNHRTIGAIAPSGSSPANLLAEPLRERAQQTSRGLEVGAGTGSVTRVLLRRLPGGGRLDVVGANARFAAHLRRLVHSHPSPLDKQQHARVHNILLEQLTTDRRYDMSVSGLPFTNFSPRQVEEIMGRYLELLRPGGALTYFAHRGDRWVRALLASRRAAHRQRAVKDVLHQYRNRYAVGCWTVWGNLPPRWGGNCAGRPGPTRHPVYRPSNSAYPDEDPHRLARPGLSYRCLHSAGHSNPR